MGKVYRGKVQFDLDLSAIQETLMKQVIEENKSQYKKADQKKEEKK